MAFGYTNLTSLCSPSNIPHPTVFGAEILSLSAAVVSNYSGTSLEKYNYNHPTITYENMSFCNVTVSYTHPGENDNIYVETWLPIDGWNERLQASGGGGWVAGRFFLSYTDMAAAVSQGFAASTTDAGLGSAQDASPWALLSPGNVNLYLLNDLGSVSLNDQSIISKSLIDSGRQGLMLAQRYPNAYDGIAASAPAINWSEFIMNIYYPVLMMNTLNYYPPACEFDAIQAAATAFCDPLDGVTDGVVSSLYDCPFDPLSIVGTSFNCSALGTTRQITEAGVMIANATWEGSRSSNGSFLWYGLNYDTSLSGDGSTSGYALDTTTCASNGTCAAAPSDLVTQWIQLFIEKNVDFPVGNLTREAFDSLVHASKQQFDDIVSANDPDLNGFRAAGGKMLTYHGMADEIIPPGGSEQYYRSVTKLIPDVHDFYRLFPAPGIGHCSGGAGGQPVTTFDALRAWVENGTVPDTLPVSFNSSGGVVYERDLCPYPLTQTYDGSGDSTLASSFSCL